MFYIDIKAKIYSRLQELDKKDFAKYKDMSAGELTEEYKEQEELIKQFNILQKYDRALHKANCLYNSSHDLFKMFADRGIFV